MSQENKDKAAGITQGGLVARLQIEGVKIGQSGLSKLENGLRPVLDIEIRTLAKALKVSATWLLEGE